LNTNIPRIFLEYFHNISSDGEIIFLTYFHNISMVIPYYGIRQNHRQFNFQLIPIILPWYFHAMELDRIIEIEYPTYFHNTSMILPYYELGQYHRKNWISKLISMIFPLYEHKQTYFQCHVPKDYAALGILKLGIK
jgi:hypothetical protein